MKESQIYGFKSSGMCCFVTGRAVSCILKVLGAFVVQAQAVQEEDVITTILQNCVNRLAGNIKLYLRRLVSSATLLWASQIFVVQVVAISFDHHLNLACCFWSNDCDCSSSDRTVCQFDKYNNYMACHWWKYCTELFVTVLVVYSRHTVLSKMCLLLRLLVSAAWHWWVVQILTSLKVKCMYLTRRTTTDSNSSGLHVQHKHTLQPDVL